MNNSTRTHLHRAIIGVLVAAPAFWFVSQNILKYVLGWLPDIEVIAFHPAILIGGASLAVLLNALSVIKFKVEEQGDERMFVIGLMNRGLNLAVIFITAGLLSVMFVYLVVENFPLQGCA